MASAPFQAFKLKDRVPGILIPQSQEPIGIFRAPPLRGSAESALLNGD